jgi:hypothetical protein
MDKPSPNHFSVQLTVKIVGRASAAKIRTTHVMRRTNGGAAAGQQGRVIKAYGKWKEVNLGRSLGHAHLTTNRVRPKR